MKFPNAKQLTALLLLCGLLVGCGEAGAPSGSQSDGSEGSTAVRDNLPDDLDFNGETIRITIGDYSDAWWGNMYAEESTGNRLNDAIFNSIRSVEERLKVNLEYTREQFGWSTMSDYQTKITAQIMAGDAGFDLLFSGSTNFSSLTVDNHYFGDLSSLKYVNLDSPWYNKSALECIPGDYVDFVMGEFAIGNVDNTFCMYFNQTLLDEMQITEDMYDIVDSGKWTLDKMSELIRGGYADLNGNTEQDAGDRWGLTFGDINKYLGFLKSCDVNMYRYTKDGFVYEFANERAVNTMAKLRSIIYDSGEAHFAPPLGDADWCYNQPGSNYMSKPFVEGNVMFSAGLVTNAQTTVSDLTFEWGILPYPKYDETMKEYQSVLQRYIYAMVPSTLTKTDATGAVLEALCSSTYHDVIPEYVEVSLKVRYSPDEDVSRMFDLIRNNIVIDPAEVYSNLLEYPSGRFKEGLYPQNPEWPTFIAGFSDSLNAKMEKLFTVVK
ncbi:MAG: extracellular solute-binding protein [Ruminococcaceae bacterium]|nr:extracellular solute-binding protein [Oscillospiraceae bacterium]